jgi:hypothetical protein
MLGYSYLSLHLIVCSTTTTTCGGMLGYSYLSLHLIVCSILRLRRAGECWDLPPPQFPFTPLVKQALRLQLNRSNKHCDFNSEKSGPAGFNTGKIKRRARDENYIYTERIQIKRIRSRLHHLRPIPFVEAALALRIGCYCASFIRPSLSLAYFASLILNRF